MNNYLANIAARTMNTEPLVRPRLSGRFEPRPASREPGIDSGALNQLRSEPHLPINAVIDSPPLDETHKRRRADIRQRRTNNSSKPEPPPADGARDIDVVAITATSVSDPISPPPSLSTRPLGVKTLAQPAPFSTHFDERLIEDRGAVASIETGKANNTERRRTPREESRFDEPAQVPSHRVKAPEGEQVPAGVDRQPTKEKRPLNVRVDEQRLVRSLERARPVIERGLETVIIREKRIVDEPGRGSESPAKCEDSSALPSLDEPDHPATKVTPVAVQTLVAPKVEVVPKRMPPARFDAQPQPTIHVTIGRIEIRAVQSPQPAIKSRGPTPVMNLDDYLRRRNQGNAR